jgi:hypothetical protein
MLLVIIVVMILGSHTVRISIYNLLSDCKNDLLMVDRLIGMRVRGPQPRCTWAFYAGPLCPNRLSWEPSRFTKAPDGPQGYLLMVVYNLNV